MTHTDSHLILLGTYLLLTFVNIIAVVLYHKAYYQMHKTKMIKSVYFLLATLLIENIYFGMTAFFNSVHNTMMYDLLTQPPLWAAPKILFLIALVYFIQASLAPSDFEADMCKDCKHLPKSK